MKRTKSADVQLGMYNNFGLQHNDKDPRFKDADHVRISRWKNILAKDYARNWSKEVLRK